MFVSLFQEEDKNPDIIAAVSLNGVLVILWKCKECGKETQQPGYPITRSIDKPIWFMEKTIDPYNFICDECRNGQK